MKYRILLLAIMSIGIINAQQTKTESNDSIQELDQVFISTKVIFGSKYEAADFEIMLRFLEKYKINTYYLKDPLVKMRLGGETNKSFKNIYYQNLECLRAFKKNDLKVNKLLYPFFRIIPKLFQFKKS